jgi:hypothetical protein
LIAGKFQQSGKIALKIIYAYTKENPKSLSTFLLCPVQLHHYSEFAPNTTSTPEYRRSSCPGSGKTCLFNLQSYFFST